MARRLAVLSALTVAGVLFAQSPAAPPSDEQIRREIERGKAYTVAFLRSGDAALPAAEEVQRLQWAHLRNLFTLKAEGLATLSGPFTGPAKGDLRGMVIFNTADEAVVRARLDADPYVRAGLMRYELQPWFGLPGDGVR